MLDGEGTLRIQIYIYLMMKQIERIITITVTDAFFHLGMEIVIFSTWYKWCTCCILI